MIPPGTDTLTFKSDAAFLIAMRKVLERARAAGHGIVTWHAGRVVEITCDEAEQRLRAAELKTKNGHQ